MQRPPGSGRPLLLSNRSPNEWINRVAQKHREFTSLQLSADQRDRIGQWVEATFVLCTLGLEGLEVTQADVARAFASASARRTTTPELNFEVVTLLAAFRLLRDLVQTQGSGAALTPELLLQLHDGAEEFRKSHGERAGPANPAAPEHLPASVESACRWFSAESFAELNPIEQASIVHLRLLEIQPFEAANPRIAILAASLFSLRGGLPPVMIGPDLADGYARAIEASRSGNTQPMVELMGTAAERAFERMIGLAS